LKLRGFNNLWYNNNGGIYTTQIKPNYKMNLNEAVNRKMDNEAFEAYLSFHEISVTRRDD